MSPVRILRCSRTPRLAIDRVGSVAQRDGRTRTEPSERHSPPTRTATFTDRPAGSRCTTSADRAPGFTRATGAVDADPVTRCFTRTGAPAVPGYHVTPARSETARGGCPTDTYV